MQSLKKDKKSHILNVAEKVFSEYGFDGASTRMISSRAGVNLAMLNYYFGSKEGLFLEIFKRKVSLFPQILQNISENQHLTPWEKLINFIDNFVESILVNDSFHELISRELIMHKHWDVTDKITELIMRNVYEVKKIIDEGVKVGSFKSTTDVGLIMATMFGIKNYIINNKHISSLMIGYDIININILDDEIKPRIRIYLLKLLKSYLLDDTEIP